MIKRNKNKEICWGKTTTTTASNKKNPGYIMIFMHKYMFLVFFSSYFEHDVCCVSLSYSRDIYTYTHHNFAASLNRKRDNRHHQVKRLSRMKTNEKKVILTWRSSEDDNQNHKTKNKNWQSPLHRFLQKKW